jgi:glutathione synthase/RimK-type ligase-like ATP-grasp enzyme
MHAGNWDRGDPAPLIAHCLDLNAAIWRRQTGIALMEPRSGKVSLAVPGESMLGHAVRLWKQAGGAFVAANLTSRLVDLLHTGDPELVAVSRSCESLNHKNSAMRLLTAHSIPSPWTLTADDGVRSADEARDVLSVLPKDGQYVLKADGATAGVGVYTNHHAGYDVPALTRLVLHLLERHRLPSRFQIQEYFAGRSMSALAVFRTDGGFDLLSIQEQGLQNGEFISAHWRRPVHERLAPQVAEVYRRIASIPGLRLLGPVGIDFQESNGDIAVVEVNARLTGSAPIPWILQALERAAVPVDSVDLLIGVDLDQKLILGNGLLPAIEAALSEPSARGPGSLPRMILPQGLNAFGKSRILLVNDLSGRLRKALPGASA